MSERYDWIIIGAGPGGYEAAAIASARGESVVLIERDMLGGTCLNRGCIPTKCFCHTAEVASMVAGASEAGVNLSADTIAVDAAAMTARKNAVVAGLREQVAAVVSGCTVVSGEARLVKAEGIDESGRRLHAVEVTAPEGTLLRFNSANILIATGSEPTILPIPGAELTVTSNELLDLQALPQSVIVIGGGVIGMEFASIFHRLGVEVTVVEFCPEILPALDAEVAKRLRTTMKHRGVDFHVSSRVDSVEAVEGEIKRVHFTEKNRERTAEAEVVLMAVGRRPVIPEGVPEVGIETGRRGIVVDPLMRTSVEGIRAIGDCNGLCQLAHAASAQARLVMGENVDLSVVPSAVFTMPECAMVGLTQAQAEEQNPAVKVGKAFYRANGKACAMAEADGMVKIITERDTDRILGCHIFGTHASDLISEVAVAMSNGLTASDLLHTIHAHPTLPELITAALAAAR